MADGNNRNFLGTEEGEKDGGGIVPCIPSGLPVTHIVLNTHKVKIKVIFVQWCVSIYLLFKQPKMAKLHTLTGKVVFINPQIRVRF